MIALREPLPRAILNWRENAKRCTISLNMSGVGNVMEFIHATYISITLTGETKPSIWGLISLLRGDSVIKAVNEAKMRGLLEINLPILINDDMKIEVFQCFQGRAVGCRYEIKKY